MADINKLYDVIIIGGGATGLAAGLYAGRDRSETLIIEKGFFGGQISITSEVENYPGILQTSGPELIDVMHKQAENFSCEFVTAEVLEIIASNREIVKTVKTNQGDFKALSVIVATGANPRSAGFENEDKFKGRGVSFCATCDAMFYKDKEVYVIGGGFAACEEAEYLTKFASKVTMVIRRDEFSAPISIANDVIENEKIEVRFNTKISKVEGEMMIEKIHFTDTKTQESYVESFEPGSVGIFVFTGYIPESKIIESLVELDETGGAITNDEMETDIAGLYVAGDIRQKRLRQLVTAAADGAIAATMAGKYVNELKRNQSPEFVKICEKYSVGQHVDAK